MKPVNVKLRMITVAAGFAMQTAFAMDAFKVNAIVVTGNDHISKETILNYLPVRATDTVDDKKVSDIIKTLYHTGLFSNVSLSRSGDNLIVAVNERSIIGSISYSGNSIITKEKLDQVLKQAGLLRGQIFDNTVLERVEKSLHSAYLEQGHYNAVVDVAVKAQDKNRVKVTITIDEGKATKIRSIQILGNNLFSAFQITKDFEMTTPRPWSFLTGGDHYTKEKLEQDVEKLRQFYLDRGYLQVKVDSYSANITQDKRWADIIIHVTEGAQFRFVGYRLAGELLGSEEELQHKLDLPINTVYSQKTIQDALKKVADHFGSRGYAYANVQVMPTVNEADRTVFISFFVAPGRHIYVRRISFAGNTKTQDKVLRREMRQAEASSFSSEAMERSLRNLRVLGYLKDVSMALHPVQGADDMVDVDVSVKEMSSSTAMISGGYGTNGVGLTFGASLNQQDFLGTGNYVGLNFQRDQYQKTYSFDYVNPYVTPNGVSRGIHFYSQRTSPSRINLADYSYDNFGGSVDFRIPWSDYSGTKLGLGYERIVLHQGPTAAAEILNFISQNGDSFNHAILSLGWDYNTYNQVPFTTSGVNQDLNLTVSLSQGTNPLDFYKVGYQAHWYQSLTRQVIFSLSGNLGYGNGFGRTRGGLPFFENYLAGGFDTVRGYDAGSLGPKSSNNNPLGGNALAAASASVIFPNPVSENLRTSVFLDGGNVYNTRLTSVRLGDFRYSTGVAAVWKVPMIGEIRFSVSKTLNAHNGDRPRVFDFSFGTGF